MDEILVNAKRWAKTPVLNEPLFRYWMKYNRIQSITLSDFRDLVLYGEASRRNVVSINSPKVEAFNSRAVVQPRVDLNEFFSLHIEKSRRVPLTSGNESSNEYKRKNS